MRLGGRRRKEPAEAELELARLRAARVEEAEKAGWTRLEETQLVRRGPGWLVDAGSDHVFKVASGSFFEPGRSALLSGYGRTDLSFIVDRDGDVVVLERLKHPASWSDHVRRQALRGAA